RRLLFLCFGVCPSGLPSCPTRRSSDLPLPSVIDAEIRGDPVQPRRQVTAPELGDVRAGAKQCLLRQVVRFLATEPLPANEPVEVDRKSTRLNSSHQIISYAVFCLKKKR